MRELFFTPMKTFFLSFCILCIISVFLFSFDNIDLHIFLFLDLALSCAYAGFLLTAFPSWFNYSYSLKKHNIILFSLFFVSFLCGFYDLFAARIVVILFWIYLVGLCYFIAFKSKQFDTLLLPISFIPLIKIGYLLTSNTDFNYILIHVNVIALSMVNFKISFAIASSAFELLKKDYMFIANKFYKNLVVFFVLILCIESLSDIFYMQVPLEVKGFSALAVGIMIMARLSDWHYKIFWGVHYIIIFYIAQASIGLSYMVFGLSYLLDLNIANAFHLIAFTSIFFMFLIVLNIAGLRHNGLDLRFPILSRLSMGVLLAGGIFRYFECYYISLGLVSATFLIEFFIFLKIFKETKFRL